MIFAIDKNGQQFSVVLSPEAVARGGEAELFEVAEQPQQVAKVFLPKYRTEAKRDKINYLIQHNPNQIGDKDVIWPTHTLWENAQFIGFLMPKAVGEKLELLCSPAPKGKKMDKFLQKYPQWQRFLLSEPQGLMLRLKLCYNLLVAVEKLHKTGLYVLVDLKPDNIIIQPNGLVSIIDTDSLQVADNQLFLPANVCTPEYCPAEYYQGLNFTKSPISPTWDYFSLAVVIYRLVLGIHPFSASCEGQYQDCTSVDQLIRNGLLPILPAMAQHFHTIPPPHNEFFKLPNLVQNYLLDSLQTATQRPILAFILPQWYQWVNQQKHQNRNIRTKIARRTKTTGLAIEKPQTELNLAPSVPLNPFAQLKTLHVSIPAGDRDTFDSLFKRVEFIKPIQNVNSVNSTPQPIEKRPIDKFMDFVEAEIKKKSALGILFQVLQYILSWLLMLLIMIFSFAVVIGILIALVR